MTFKLPHTKPVFKHQPDAVLDQVDPVQNTWYPILETTNAEILGVAIGVLVADETLELRITLDGQAYVGSLACTAGTDYEAVFWTIQVSYGLHLRAVPATPAEIYRSVLCKGRSVKVEVRKTTATGAGNLRGCVSYGKME